MQPAMEGERSITQLLRRYNEGDRAVWEEFVPILYQDLRRLARQRLRGERHGHTLSTTALVNECYLRLIENRQLAAEDRAGFLAIASQTMRRVLVDYARGRNREKRGRDQEKVPLEEAENWLTDREAEEVVSLDAALGKLNEWDARAAQVVELRFFGGLSLEETAQVLGVSAKTIQRTWLTARAWLRKEIGPLSNDV
ncbi:MAG: ECF-type sigma factor [Bryobacteraceae bacterium]